MTRKAEPKLRNCIRELRMAASGGMTQQELAQRIEVTRQTVVALERGGYVPSLALALRIAKVFHRPVESVFWFEGDPPQGDSTTRRMRAG